MRPAMRPTTKIALAVAAVLSLATPVLAQERPAQQQPSPGRTKPWDGDALRAFATIAVQDGGRVKPLDTLAGQCERFLAETEELYVHAFDRLLRTRIGIGLDDARRWDVSRALRAPGWDGEFPGDRMLPALEATLADLGIDNPYTGELQTNHRE